MSGGSSAPPPIPAAPNYGPVIEANQRQIDAQKDMFSQSLDWAKQQYADNKGYSDTVRQKLMDTLDENTANARQDRARYQNVYQPLEDQIVGEASAYDTPERRLKARGQATADVGAHFDAANANATRELERYGADPTAVRYASLDLGSRLARASAQAGASEAADARVEQTGINYRLQAANMGKGLPAQAIAGYNTGTSAGTSGVNAGNSTTAGAAGALGNPMGYNAGINSSIGTWGNLLNTQYGNEMQGYGAWQKNNEMAQNSSSGSGSALGAVAGIGMGAMMMMSDERAKEDMKEVGKTKDGQSIYSYRLKGSPKTQLGLSAQETEKRHPEAVATGPDGYKRVDYHKATRHAVNMAGGGTLDDGTGTYLDPSMSPSGGAVTDDIPGTGPGGSAVNLNAREFVMPADVVMHRGKQWMQKQVVKARQEMGDPNATRVAKPTIRSLPHPTGVPRPPRRGLGIPHIHPKMHNPVLHPRAMAVPGPKVQQAIPMGR